MRKPVSYLFCVLCLLLSGAIASGGARQLPRIQGAVVDPAGKPAAGATVLIVSRARVTSATADKAGKFSIELAEPQRTFG